MKKYLLPLAFLVLAGCKSQEGETGNTDKDSRTASRDSLLVTETRWGHITAETDLETLQDLYGSEAIADSVIFGPEGIDTLNVTYVFPGRPAEIVVHWKDSFYHKKISMVECYQAGAPYITEDSLKIGSSFRDLLNANGQPVNFSGFGWDYGGYIMSYNGGRLDSSRIIYRLTSESELPNGLYGDSELNTTQPLVQQHLDNIRIYWLSLSFQ